MRQSRKEIFLKYFESIADKYNPYRQRYRYYWKDIVSFCNYFINENDSVVEIGCGTGWTISRLKGAKKTGIDFSPKMIEIARKEYPDVTFQVMDAENISLETTYDVIVISNAIGYFENILDVFNSIKKICRPDTRILITYYNHFWEPFLKFVEFLGLKKKMPASQNWLSIPDIENLLYLAEFEAYHEVRRVLLPIYIPVISYLVNRFLARLPLINSFCLNEYIFARPVFHFKQPTDNLYSTSVVIPARNESGNIENAITRLPKFGKHVEIIFIEGNSTDDTWQKIQEVKTKYAQTHDIKIAQQQGKGKGDAVRKGFDIANGDILMILDADLTVPPEELPKFYHAIASGKAEFINGSRLVYPMEKKAMRPLNTLGNRFFSKAFTWILGQRIKDTLCGTKVMFKDDYKKLAINRNFFGEFDPFGDFDLIFGAYKLNLKIIDLPVCYRERIYGTTNISRFKHGFLLLRMLAFAAMKIKFW